MKIVFMGTPDFSVRALDGLKQAGHEILCVYSQPPRKSGRGQKPKNTPVHAYALANGWPVRTPLTLKNNQEELNHFKGLQADIGIVVAYGLLLPEEILTSPTYGCLNIHGSLLPRWRGAAPIQRAIESGDSASGITIMQMDKGLDTGHMLLTQEIPLTPHISAGILHDDLAAMGADLICKTLETYSQIIPQKQDDSLATYAHKITKEETKLSFHTLSAVEIERKIRAFSPFPATYFEIATPKGSPLRLKILSAHTTPASAEELTHPIGSLINDDTLKILCTDNRLLVIDEIQKSGKKPMDVKSFLLGHNQPPTQWKFI